MSVVRVSGATKMVFATGAKSEFRNIFPRARGSKASGRTPKKSAAFSEYSFSLMRRIPDLSLKGSRRLMSHVATLTLS